MKKKSLKNKTLPFKNPADPKALMKLKTSLAIIIALFAFILYAQSIDHSYTLDDHPVIDENSITTTGIEGIPTIFKTDYWYGSGHDNLRGPIYRPTSLTLFAIVWQISPNNPHAYHFINVLLYAITCLILFLVLCKLFKKQNQLFPFVCAILYTAHPIHTEVVNSIKSLDEILCFLFEIISIWFFLKYISTRSIASFIAGSVSYYLALTSKESGITFLAIIPLIIFFFTDSSIKKTGMIAISLGTITGIWLIIRMLVFKDLPPDNGVVTNVLNNTLNAAPDQISKYATIFYILLRYITLLIFPHPLTCDYNFSEIKIQTLSDLTVLFAVLFYLALIIYSIYNFRKKNIPAFGILFFLITLSPISNVFFMNGSTMAERFMYTPSLGFCICLAYLLIKLTKTESINSRFKNLRQFISFNPVLFFLVFGITILYSLKTFSRNEDWKDTLTIFSHDIKTSENSATANRILANALIKSVNESPDKKGQTDTFNIAKKYLLRAIEIYPGYTDPFWDLGNIYYNENNFDSALYYQKKELLADKDNIGLNYIYGNTLNKLKKYDEAIPILNKVIALDPKNEGGFFDLALSYTNKGDQNKGFYYLSKVIELNPKRADAYYYSGVILRAKGDTVKAKEFMGKAEALGYNTK